MIKIPLFASLLTCVLSSLPAAVSEPDPSANAATFSIQITAEASIPSPSRIGSFRVLLGDTWIIGGGLQQPISSMNMAEAVLTPAATFLSKAEAGWESTLVQLPEAVSWPAAVPSDDALIVIGGLRESGISNKVSSWRQTQDGWAVTELPPLPYPLAFCGAAIMDGVLYVAGGSGPEGINENLFHLRMGTPEAKWELIQFKTHFPLMQPSLVVRKDEAAIQNALFILGGWTMDENAPDQWTPANELYKFLPEKGQSPELSIMSSAPPGLYLYSASELGPSHILGVAIDAKALTQPPALMPIAGFPDANFLRYHVFTDTWTTFTSGADHTVSALKWLDDKDLLFTWVDESGREQISSAEIISSERHFTILDYVVMALYMMGLVAIGRYFASRERSTEDFFLGGRRVPWWAAGLSIYATGTSAISFMAIPAKTYATDWLYFIGMSIFPFFTVLIAAYVFIPLLRRLELTTVMEYFELRFGRPVRLLMSAIAVLGQIAGRMSITLLLPSIALTAVTGLNLYLCILVMGVLATIYTAVGGINAVIWTDVLQVFVLFGGALLSFILIVMQIDGGISSMITLAVADNKFNFLDSSWDFTTATIWVMVLWAVSDVFGKGLGQEGLQRAFSTKGVKEARRSMITCAVVALPAGFLFYGIGTALYSFYHAHPELLNPTLQTDAIFPLFIAQQLPVGIAGLVISGLFAASMSTLDTAMNTSATIVVRDFYSIWRKDKGDHEQLVLAKVVTIICGVTGTGIAIYMASFKNLGSLWDLFSILLGMIGGGLGGVGVLAFCTTRANTWGTLAGAVVTAISIVLIKQYTPVHFFIYGTLSMAIGSISGYLFSLIIPDRNKKDLTGLTLWTPAPKDP